MFRGLGSCPEGEIAVDLTIYEEKTLCSRWTVIRLTIHALHGCWKELEIYFKFVFIDLMSRVALLSFFAYANRILFLCPCISERVRTPRLCF